MLYTPDCLQILQSLLARLLPCWGLADDSVVSLVTVSENATFQVEDASGRRILRVYRPGYHCDAEIFSELLWMQALAQTDIIRIPRLYPTCAGDLLVIREEAGKRWRVACFEYLPGVMPVADKTLPQWFGKLGAVTARLHGFSRGWQKPQGFCRKHWTYETMAGAQAYWGDWRALGGLEAADRRLLVQCDRALQKQAGRLEKNADTFLLLHGDLRLANLLVEGDSLAAIDFDDSGFSWPALDFANAVSFMEDHPLVPELQAAWLEGYATVTASPQDMVAAIPLFIMLRRMQLTAWLATHAEIPVAQELGETFLSGTLALAEKFLMR